MVLTLKKKWSLYGRGGPYTVRRFIYDKLFFFISNWKYPQLPAPGRPGFNRRYSQLR